MRVTFTVLMLIASVVATTEAPVVHQIKSLFIRNPKPNTNPWTLEARRLHSVFDNTSVALAEHVYRIGVTRPDDRVMAAATIKLPSTTDCTTSGTLGVPLSTTAISATWMPPVPATWVYGSVTTFQTICLNHSTSTSTTRTIKAASLSTSKRPVTTTCSEASSVTSFQTVYHNHSTSTSTSRTTKAVSRSTSKRPVTTMTTTTTCSEASSVTTFKTVYHNHSTSTTRTIKAVSGSTSKRPVATTTATTCSESAGFLTAVSKTSWTTLVPSSSTPQPTTQTTTQTTTGFIPDETSDTAATSTSDGGSIDKSGSELLWKVPKFLLGAGLLAASIWHL